VRLRLCMHLRVLDTWLHWLSALLVQVSARSGPRSGTPLPARGPGALLPSTEVLRLICDVGLRVPPPQAGLGWWCAFLLAGGAPLRRLRGWAEDPESLVLLAQARDLHRSSQRLGSPEHRHATACACGKGRQRMSDQKSACREGWNGCAGLSQEERFPNASTYPPPAAAQTHANLRLPLTPNCTSSPAPLLPPSPAQHSTLRSSGSAA
jgi:hypothetical protein